MNSKNKFRVGIVVNCLRQDMVFPHMNLVGVLRIQLLERKKEGVERRTQHQLKKKQYDVEEKEELKKKQYDVEENVEGNQHQHQYQHQHQEIKMRVV